MIPLTYFKPPHFSHIAIHFLEPTESKFPSTIYRIREMMWNQIMGTDIDSI